MGILLRYYMFYICLVLLRKSVNGSCDRGLCSLPFSAFALILFELFVVVFKRCLRCYINDIPVTSAYLLQV